MDEHEGMEPEDLVELFRNSDSVKEALDELTIIDFLGQVENWDREQCQLWVEHYVGKGEGILGLPPEALNFECRLFEALLAQCSRLRMGLDLSASRFLHEVVMQSRVLSVPRRYMVPAYLHWIEAGFVPGIGVYRSYVLGKATAEEGIAVAETAIAAWEAGHHSHGEWCIDVLLQQLEVAWRHAPGRVIPWCDFLQQDGELCIEDEALIAFYRSKAMDVVESMSALHKDVHKG